MRVVCAWCKQVIKPGEPAPVSHTICKPCGKKVEARCKEELARRSESTRNNKVLIDPEQ